MGKMEVKTTSRFNVDSDIKTYLSGEELSCNDPRKFILASLSTTDFCQKPTLKEKRVFVNKDMEGNYNVQGIYVN